MRFVIGAGWIALAVLLTGCHLFHSSHKPSPAAPPVITQAPKPVIKPDLRVTGQVAMVNPGAKFVIVTFPPGPVPAAGQHLAVYRNGSKVGALTVTGPQRETDTVADITAGDIQLHDEVRAE